MSELEINGRKFIGWQADVVLGCIFAIIMLVPFIAGLIIGMNQ
jgi:hypothetical protein